MKPTKTFKLSKRTKTIRALIGFKTMDQNHSFKRMMIQAELAAAIRPVKEKRDNSTSK
jgi:hypothetical protein